MLENTPRITTVTITILWHDPEKGLYQPIVGVSGAIPDDMNQVALIKFFIQATHEAMNSPMLALD